MDNPNNSNCLTLAQWTDIESRSSHEIIESRILPVYLKDRRWFAGKSKTISSVSIVRQLQIPGPLIPPYLWLMQVNYTNGTNEKYLLPVCFIPERDMPEEQMRPPVFCNMQLGLEKGWLCDASWCDDFRSSLFKHFAMQSDINGNDSQLHFELSHLFHKMVHEHQASRVLSAEQSNTSIVYGNSLFFKLYRKVETGTNPDIEVSRFLTEEAHFEHAPAWIGEIQWRTPEGIIGVGILQQYLPKSTVGWNHFLPIIKSAIEDPAGNHDELLNKVAQLGAVTAGMHNALIPEKNNDAFSPEWADVQEQEGLRGRVMTELVSSFEMLRKNLEKLSPDAKNMAADLLAHQQELGHILKETYMVTNNAKKIRLHGDLHLGQVLVVDDRFLVTDFEGEPGRSFEERRIKQSPIKDIAGMVRSFHYAVYSANKGIDPMLLENLLHQMTDTYITSYMHSRRDHVHESDLRAFLRLFIIEKALYELRYELNNRPDWAGIPIAGLTAVIREWSESAVHHHA